MSLCTCRSETELQLWSLQRHTELGGTVPRTSAGLKAPKQVSGSRHRSLQQQSHFPLLTLNAAVLNAPLKIRCLLCFHLQPWNLVHPNEALAPQIHSPLHDGSIVESCVTETGITDEFIFAEGPSVYSLEEKCSNWILFLLLYLSYLEAAAPAAAKLKLWINKLEQFSHNKPAACWKSLSSRLLFEEQAIKQKLIFKKTKKTKTEHRRFPAGHNRYPKWIPQLSFLKISSAIKQIYSSPPPKNKTKKNLVLKSYWL